MKRLLAFFNLMGITGLCLANPLIQPADLNKLLSDPSVRVIDVRSAKLYEANHIPGALSAPYDDWRGGPSNPGELQLPKLTALVRSLGISPDNHAVVASSGEHATDFGSGAHVYWMLKVLGVKKLSILNGGYQAWSEASLPQSRDPVKVAASNFSPAVDKRYLVTREEVAARVPNNKVKLLDARPSSFFKGDDRHPAAKQAGTIRNAVLLESFRFFNPGTGMLMEPESLRKVAAGVQADKADEVVNFCNAGQWSATNWFAMSEVLGMKNVKMYPGSMVDYTQAATPLPMDNVPSRGKKLLFDAKNWSFN